MVKFKRFENKKRKREEPEWIVAVLVVLALVAGWFIKVYIENKTVEFTNNEISFSYPENWIVETNIYANDLGSGFRGRPEDISDKILIRASSMISESIYKTNVSLRSINKSWELQTEGLLDSIPGIIFNIADQYESTYDNFTVIDNEKVTISGEQGIKIDYSFVSKPVTDSGGYYLPVIVYGMDYIIPVNNTVYILTVRLDADKMDDEMDFCEKMIEQFHIKG